MVSSAISSVRGSWCAVAEVSGLSAGGLVVLVVCVPSGFGGAARPPGAAVAFGADEQVAGGGVGADGRVPDAEDVAGLLVGEEVVGVFFSLRNGRRPLLVVAGFGRRSGWPVLAAHEADLSVHQPGPQVASAGSVAARRGDA